ncbi:MAG: alanine racemase [Bacteroidales bacterium]
METEELNFSAETELMVNMDAMISNYKFFKSKVKPDTKMICMLKASGYGAGLVELAQELEKVGVSYIAVAVTSKGVELREGGIKTPIIVLNSNRYDCETLIKYNLEPEVYNLEILGYVVEAAKKLGVTNHPIHIKLDTGMHRLGFLPNQLPELINLIKSEPTVKIESIFTHLAGADEERWDDYTRGQLQLFEQGCQKIQSNFDYKILRHALNSSGTVRFSEFDYDMVRLGIGLYGVRTIFDGSQAALREVSALYTTIISIKEWSAENTIGYGRKGVLTKDSVIATIPIGYADGIDRHLGNGNMQVYINGAYAPTIGNICMDMCMIDITGIDCKVGDKVEIFGNKISVEKLSDRLETIPYEILTSIGERVKRTYYNSSIDDI